MGFAVLSQSEFNVGDLPVYGDIVAIPDLKVGVRASGLDNFIDLSNLDHMLTNTGCTLSPMLQKTSHLGGVSTSYQAADNAFTIYSIAQCTIDAGKTYSHDVCGNFGSSSTGGFGIRIIQEAIGDGNFRIVARALMTRKVISTGLLASFYLSVTLLDNLSAVPATLPWYVLSVRFDPVAKVYEIKEHTTGVSSTLTSDNTLWAQSALNHADRTSAGFNNAWLVLRDTASAYSGTTKLPEHMYWNKALTSAELTQQLAYSRSFMLNARGVTLP